MAKLLNIFSKRKVEKKKERVVVDHREKNSLVVSCLMGMGYEIEFRQLAVGDYEVGGVVIERKTVSDFKSSIVNKRIVSQLLELKQYRKSFLIVEGIVEEDVYSGQIHENAFRGFMLSVLLEFGVGVIYTHDAEDTAKYIDVLVRRREKGEIGIRASKILLSKKEQQQFILEGFPNVGAVKAKALLKKFGSLKGVFNASLEELNEMLGVRAEEFRKLLE